MKHKTTSGLKKHQTKYKDKSVSTDNYGITEHQTTTYPWPHLGAAISSLTIN